MLFPLNFNRIGYTCHKIDLGDVTKYLDQILVTGTANVYYLTGVWCEPFERMLALHVTSSGDMTLYANKMFALQGLTDVKMVEYEDTDDCISVLAPGMLPGKLGIDKTWHSHFTIRLMQARPDVIPALGSAPLDEARIIKDFDEHVLGTGDR